MKKGLDWYIFWIDVAVLVPLIIWKVGYTEIDYKTYLQQSRRFWRENIVNYEDIGGDSGPCVYPAGHLYFYGFIDFLSDFLMKSDKIRFGQIIFGLLYSLNLFIVHQLYKKVRQDLKFNFQLIPVIKASQGWSDICLGTLSLIGKRIHSIFLLRMFNDPVAMLFYHLYLYGSIVAQWNDFACTLILGLALTVKMNILLALPAWAFLLLSAKGLVVLIGHVIILAGVQILVSLPFLSSSMTVYLGTAYNFGRRFLHEWSVNFNFVPQDIFQSRQFHLLLLLLHLSLLAFILCTFILVGQKTNNSHYASQMYYKFFLNAIFGTHRLSFSPYEKLSLHAIVTFVGIACARSLHYQFYSWYFYWLPLLLTFSLDRKGKPKMSSLGLERFVLEMIISEILWNIYPITPISSLCVTLFHIYVIMKILVALVLGLVGGGERVVRKGQNKDE